MHAAKADMENIPYEKRKHGISLFTSVSLVTFLLACSLLTKRVLRDNTEKNVGINVRNLQIGTGQQFTTNLLLGIFSTNLSDSDKERRELIRKTYLSEAGERICSLPEYVKQVKDHRTKSKPKSCQVPYVFVIGGNNDRPMEHYDHAPLLVDIEDDEKDVIYLNIKENMEHGKSPTFFKYGASIAANYGIDYIAKADSDTVISLHLLLDFIDYDLPPSPYNQRIYGGAPRADIETESMYAAGELYIMSSDLAHHVGFALTNKDRTDLRTEHHHIEDMDMGRFIYSHPNPIKFLVGTRMVYHHPVKKVNEYIRKWLHDMPRLPLKQLAFSSFWHNCRRLRIRMKG
jgi:hypothetical protein